MSDGRLNFKATIDDADFNRKLNNMEKGVDGLTFTKPTESINRLKKEIEEVNSVLIKNRRALIDLDNKLASTAPGQLKKDLQLERNSLKKSIQEDEVALKNLNAELKRTKASHTTVNAELLKTRQRMAELVVAGKQNTAEYQQLSAKAKEYSNALKQVGNDTTEVSKRSRGLKGVFTTIASYFGVFAAISTVMRLIRGAFNTIVDFDSRLLNVSKTTGLAGQELKDLGVSLRNLSQELKVISVDKLMEFAGVAGQLGIKGTQEILAFTEALAKLSVTSNIQGEEGAIQIARFLGLVEGNVKNVKDLGDELTNLGNNFKVFEDEIIKNALAIAQNTGTFKLGRQEILAYATSLKEAGVEAELTGASLGRTYQQIEKVLRTGKNIDNLAKITGQSVEDLKEAFKTDPQGVVYSFIKGLNEVQEAGGSVNNAITSIGITATRDLRVIGTLATGGFDVLNRAMNDVKDSSGAMQQEFETASGKISNSIESVKVSWENLILAVNNSENEIGTTISFWAKALSGLIDWIARATTSWKELNRIASGKGAESGFESVMSRRDRISVGEATQQAFLLEQELRKLNDQRRQLESDISETGSKSQRDMFKKRLEDLSGVIGYVNSQMLAYRQIASGIGKTEPVIVPKTIEELEAEAELKKAQREREALYKKRLAFLDELQKAENDLTLSTLSGLDLELAKVEEVYQNRLKKAKELGANQKALNDIESLRVREIETVTYKADTEALKISLEQQKKDYEDFENFKKQVGTQKATEMYSGIIDVSKSYYDVLRDELNNIDLSTATAKEKERVAVLFKMFQEYSISKQEEERKNLETLISMTQSYEQKILNLREEYEKKKADLRKDYTEDDLDSRLDILDKEFREKLSSIIDDFNKENNLGDISSTLIGATKSQVMAQIKSLEGYLNTATNLTQSQVNKIRGIINELNNNLFTATGNEDITSLDAYYNEIERIKEALIILESQKKNALDLGGEDAAEKVALLNAQIDALNKRLEDLNNSKIIAIGSEFGRISSFLSEMSNKFNGVNSGVQKMLNSMAKAVGFAKEMNDYFKSMSEHSNATKDGTANMSTAMSAGMGYIGMFMSLVSILDNMSKASERQAQRDAERMRLEAERYMNQLEYERLLKQLEVDRARREQLGLSSRRKELSALVDMYELELEQIERLSKIIFSETSILFEEWQGGLNSARLVKFNTSDLQLEINRVRKELEELYELRESDPSKNYNPQILALEDYLKRLKGAIIEGKTWQELQRDLDSGYIHESMREYVQGYIDLAKAAEEAGYSIEDLQNAMNEMASGTSLDELSNALANAFANGEDAVMSFGQTMEDVLKNAVVSAFKNEYIIKEMDKIMKMFDRGWDGEYTEEELDEIRKASEEAAKRLQQQWDRISEGLGFDFGSDDLGGSMKDGIKRITESQADRLTGILTGMQVDVIESRKSLQLSNNLLSSSLDNLIAIEFNTRATADNTYQMVQILQNNQQKALGL